MKKWIKDTIFPTRVCVCTSEKDCIKFKKEMQCDDDIPYLHNSNVGSMRVYRGVTSGGNVVLITLREPGKRLTPAYIGAIAHEVSHAVDCIFDYIEEKEPADEQKAYLIEYYVVEILKAIEESKKK